MRPMLQISVSHYFWFAFLNGVLFTAAAGVLIIARVEGQKAWKDYLRAQDVIGRYLDLADERARDATKAAERAERAAGEGGC